MFACIPVQTTDIAQGTLTSITCSRAFKRGTLSSQPSSEPPPNWICVPINPMFSPKPNSHAFKVLKLSF